MQFCKYPPNSNVTSLCSDYGTPSGSNYDSGDSVSQSYSNFDADYDIVSDVGNGIAIQVLSFDVVVLGLEGQIVTGDNDYTTFSIEKN